MLERHPTAERFLMMLRSQIVVLAVVGGGTWGAAKVMQWEWPLLVAFANVLFAYGLWTMAQLRQLGHGLPILNGRISQRLRDWLDRQNLSVGTREDSTHLFVIRARDEQGRIVTVARQKNRPGSLILLGGLEFSATDIEAIRVNDEGWNDFMDDVVLEISRLGLLFARSENQDKVFVMDEIALDESLTEMRFADRIHAIRRALTCLIHLTRRAVRRAGGAPSTTTEQQVERPEEETP